MSAALSELVTTEITNKPSAIVLVGPPGIGKSSVIGNIPDVLVVALKREDTWSLLKRSGAVPKDLTTTKRPLDKWIEVLTLLETLLSESSGPTFRALAIDSLTPMQNLLFEHILETRFGGDQGKFDSYGAGFKHVVPAWCKFLDRLDQLRTQRGMAIVLTAHHATRITADAEGDDYDRNTVAFDKRLWEQTYPWADAVLFARYKTVQKDGKLLGGSKRIFVSGGIAACDAKNRYGLPQEIDMGASGAEAWENLTKEIRTALGG